MIYSHFVYNVILCFEWYERRIYLLLLMLYIIFLYFISMHIPYVFWWASLFGTVNIFICLCCYLSYSAFLQEQNFFPIYSKNTWEVLDWMRNERFWVGTTFTSIILSRKIQLNSTQPKASTEKQLCSLLTVSISTQMQHI